VQWRHQSARPQWSKSPIAELGQAALCNVVLQYPNILIPIMSTMEGSKQESGRVEGDLGEITLASDVVNLGSDIIKQHIRSSHQYCTNSP
jgi:hypothetical protein